MATMTNTELLPATVLKRKAVVYVRQSSQSQVQNNLESQRRQYDLVEEARRRGFRDIEVIDDDLGRSASGMVARPGFDKLVAWLCAGEVGAVLCFDASRLAALAATGTTFLSSADWSTPASSTWTACTTPVVPTTDCFLA
jgi:DNA invertase Pin-like site-specific DNA recombinase